jgi:hypothetical protein
MTDPSLTLAAAAAGFLALVMMSLMGLKAWREWLELKRLELESAHLGRASPPSPVARIELADLKERVRKLEAIASGVDF